jgi:hypothetical protein
MATNEQEAQPHATSNRRPYAAPANVVAVLQRCRSRNLPEVIDNDFFRVVGISDIVFGRVREALGFMGLIGEDGRPTDLLQAIAAATDEEYRQLLAGAVRSAYREDFDRVDPAEDTQPRIVNAFQRYEPRSQTNRMVMLFLGLCREAGIPVLDAPRERQMRGVVGGPPRPPRARRKPSPAAPIAPSQEGMVVGITEIEISDLSEEEFNEVWAALGKVARTRAIAARRRREGSQEGGESE